MAFACLRRRVDGHAFENVGRFGELAVVVGNDFDAVAPGVEDVEPVVDAFDAEFLHRSSHRITIVDDEAEVALGIGDLAAAESELDELVAEIDEGVVFALPAG